MFVVDYGVGGGFVFEWIGFVEAVDDRGVEGASASDFVGGGVWAVASAGFCGLPDPGLDVGGAEGAVGLFDDDSVFDGGGE